MVLSISIAVIICIGLSATVALIQTKKLDQTRLNYIEVLNESLKLNKSLIESDELQDSMRMRGDLWEDKYRKLKVDYKKLGDKHDDVVKQFDEYHRRVMDKEARRHDAEFMDELSLELEQRFIEELNSRMPIVEGDNN